MTTETRPAQADQTDADVFTELGIEPPPRPEDLPESDGMPMDTETQGFQMDLLFEPLRRHFSGRQIYVGRNNIIYYSVAQARNRDFLGPDVYVVLDTHTGPRDKWIIWEEGKGPDVVLEVLSHSTIARDKGVKKQIYQDNIRAREYFWYDPHRGSDLAGFVLEDGVYVPIEPDAEGRLYSGALDLLLMTWEGDYLGRAARWLRWATPDGVLLPLGVEAAQQRADVEHERAEAERERAESAERRLAELEAELRRLRGEA